MITWYDLIGYALLLLFPVLLAYAIGQTRTALGLIGLLRRPGETLDLPLARRCATHLVVTPPVMMALVLGSHELFRIPPYPSAVEGPLQLATLTTAGQAISIVAWIGLGAWFFVIVYSPERPYRRASSLVPMVLLSQICLLYAAAVFQVQGELATRGWAAWPTGISADKWVKIIVTLYVPTAPLVGFVLLIVHLARVRAAEASEPSVEPEEDNGGLA